MFVWKQAHFVRNPFYINDCVSTDKVYCEGVFTVRS